MMPARPAPGFVFVQPHVALVSLELSFDAPPGTAHAGQGLQGSILRDVGQVVAGYTILKDNFLSILTIAPSELATRKSLAREQTEPNRKDAEKGTAPKERKEKRIPLTPEARKERRRTNHKEKLAKAKASGLCRHCGEPAIEGQTRCDRCSEGHRLSGRVYGIKSRAKAKEAQGNGAGHGPSGEHPGGRANQVPGMPGPATPRPNQM